eukprot:Phypoly_transcript_08517.p1 GENE.Phypoly_transcript_08517~~Phypoly_transcript_08517.p1  ORF type:complete len:401 (+),score=48.01 Phypoly_transcript_08517:245-1447(+)
MSTPPPSPPPITYVVKRIIFNGKKVPIALQNTNGPCPLLAVANILSLRGHFSIHEDKSVVTADELLAAVSDYLFDANTAASDALQKNHERNVNDVIQMLPNTLVGIDVNLKFDNITSFEFNSDIILFDFCNVRLVHGWLVDPQDKGYAFIRLLSYNQLVEKELERIQSTGIHSPPRAKLFVQGSPSMAKLNLGLNSENSLSNISGPSDVSKLNLNQLNLNNTTTTTTTTTSTHPPEPPSADFPDKATQALLAEQFLNETATQLTYHGLTELHSGLRDEELCVLFRNNHFNTLYKHNGELFVLVTDQGYALEPIVWEKLCQIDGDSTFLCSDFTTYSASPVTIQDGIAESVHEVEDRDLALALQLQDEENKRNPPLQGKKTEEKQRKKKDKDKEKDHCIMQ